MSSLSADPSASDATAPSEREVSALLGGLTPPPVELLRAATAPTPAEIARLRPRPAPAPKRWPMASAVAMAAGLMLSFGAWAQFSHGPVDVPVGVVTELDGPVQLGHDVTLDGEALVLVHRADRSGTVVELLVGDVTVRSVGEQDAQPIALLAGPLSLDLHAGGVSAQRASAAAFASVQVDEGLVTADTGCGPWRSLESGHVLQPQDVRAEFRTNCMGLVRTVPAPSLELPSEVLQASLPMVPPPRPERVVRVPEPEPEPVPQEILALDEPEPPAEPEPLLDGNEMAEAFARILGHVESQDVPAAALLGEMELFLSRYPGSPLASEVEVRRLELLADGNPQVAVREIEAWLADHGNHPRSVEVQYLRATVYRDRLHDCDSARDSYQVVASLGSSAQRSKAERYLLLCEEARAQPE
jgi:hypothetical protein